jgi:hypothetical protein
VLLALIAGLSFLFPGLRRRDLEFQHEIEQPRCVDRVDLGIFQGDELARSQRTMLEGRHLLAQTAKLAEGEYLAVVTLECSDGSRAIAARQPLVVDRDGVIQFKIFGGECQCSGR